MVRFRERIEPEDVPYAPWYEKHKRTEPQLKKQREHKFSYAPLISIVVPVYRTGEVFLREMIGSVINQTYANWELCIANASPDDERLNALLKEYQEADSRIIIKNLEENAGIGANTNRAFEMTNGDFIGLLDHDDILSSDALFEVVSVLNKDSDADLIYTDEDKIDSEGTRHFQPAMKPDFSIDLLRANNYICHFLVIRKSLISEIGGFREGFDGAQDHDLVLRCAERARHIVHIPRVLYHWRTHRESTADNPASKMYAYEAGMRAVREHLLRCDESGTVSHTKDHGFYKVVYDVKGEPLVSIIIPNKDSKALLKQCVDSIYEKSTYKNFEIIIVENNSSGEEIFEYYKELEREHPADETGGIKVITWDDKFNYSAINNFAVRHARGDYIVFLNNDIEVLSKDWIEGLLGNVMRKDVGAAGCRLCYPDGTIQHAGVIIGLGGIAGHAFLNMPSSRTGYMHKAAVQLNYSAVTAACMMVKKDVFEKIGGFEERLSVAFNDVDLCLRIRQEGYLIVYDAYVEMLHYESKTRGAEDTEEKVRRFQTEIEFMRTRWSDILKAGDPYYNPNLTLAKWNYSLKPN